MYDWRKTLLPSDAPMERAIKVLDIEALRIVMVVDTNGKLLGTVTDGDVRRALIRHMGMDTPLSQLMCTNPTTASVDEDYEHIQQLMKSRQHLQVPLLDQQDKVVGLQMCSYLDNSRKFDNPVVLMAGGFGKRLHPLTKDIPKPLLKVGTKPILETILGQFIDSGFSNFYISTHYKADQIKAHFGNGHQWGVNISYIDEEQPLGTAGALGNLPEKVADQDLIVMNGDLLTKIDFRELMGFHREQGGVATMCVREYDFQVPYGVVESDNHKVNKIVEKPIHKFFVNAGIYVLGKEVMRLINKDQYLDMTELLDERVQGKETVSVFPVHEYWMDIGRMNDFEAAQVDYLSMFS